MADLGCDAALHLPSPTSPHLPPPHLTSPHLTQPDADLQALGTMLIDRHLAEIPPTSDSQILQIFENVCNLLQKRSTINYLENAISSGDESVRKILGGRYELFVKASSKSCKAFEDIIGYSRPLVNLIKWQRTRCIQLMYDQGQAWSGKKTNFTPIRKRPGHQRSTSTRSQQWRN